MTKLARARVLYRHDFLISYRVYMMTGLFNISLFEGTLHDTVTIFRTGVKFSPRYKNRVELAPG